ncbi:hypothetical protein [Halopelagius longus]|uniref:DUF8055 domain-containing protein n=1 Tax=Halopelagius longus TaxID=1236180 RepID=A0A1H0Z272_9EURY|nr:hypothetical protein [Halopelagius longus]RDI72796.1 hypothetical protein DWB78_14265 [Halopelagius longus]SDQ21572.1 hypothetical protein SAMN05216278_0974 [Halopelagius longus]
MPTDDGPDASGAAESPEASPFAGRIRELAAEARRAREAFDPPGDGQRSERALECARDGVGPVVAVYVEARTAARPVAFSAEEHRLLRRALNDWLGLYARCHGVELDADFSVRAAAELLVETRDARDTARLLTRVPER